MRTPGWVRSQQHSILRGRTQTGTEGRRREQTEREGDHLPAKQRDPSLTASEGTDPANLLILDSRLGENEFLRLKALPLWSLVTAAPGDNCRGFRTANVADTQPQAQPLVTPGPSQPSPERRSGDGAEVPKHALLNRWLCLCPQNRTSREPDSPLATCCPLSGPSPISQLSPTPDHIAPLPGSRPHWSLKPKPLAVEALATRPSRSPPPALLRNTVAGPVLRNSSLA